MIWIEILSRHRDVVSRVRISGQGASIGRGYDNDVIVDDPFVAPRHLRVMRDEAGKIVAEDLGSTNGTFLDGSKSRIARLVIDGEKPLRIGQTLLRIRAPDYAVGPERIVPVERAILPSFVIAALTVALLGFVALRVWLAQTGEPRLSNYLSPLLTITGMVLIWVGVWALISRILAGRSKFLRNLLIALVGYLATLIYNELARYAAFGLTWPVLSNYEYVAVWLILAVACFLHLREISATGLWLKGAIVTVILVLAIMAQTLQQSEAFSDAGRQNTVRLLLPPAFRSVPLRAPDAFFADVAGLKASIDTDRRKSRPGEAAH
jgi:FHA domain